MIPGLVHLIPVIHAFGTGVKNNKVHITTNKLIHCYILLHKSLLLWIVQKPFI
jgi:hypothetical protein